MINLQVADVSRETSELVNELFSNHKRLLSDYSDSLRKWNKKVNVISRNTTNEELRNHIRHSLYLSTYIVDGCEHVVDAGSGGGLPGIPLGIAHPETSIHLIDVVAKKMLLTDAISRELGLKNVKSHHVSIVEFVPFNNSILVSKHAFKISDLLSMVKGKAYDRIVMLKGDDYEDELKLVEMPLKIEVHRIEAVEQSDFFKGKCIVSIQNLT